MYKKIDIFVNGRYVCSTNQARTCREAVEKFMANPRWQGLRADGHLGEVSLDIYKVEKVRAFFSKR